MQLVTTNLNHYIYGERCQTMALAEVIRTNLRENLIRSITVPYAVIRNGPSWKTYWEILVPVEACSPFCCDVGEMRILSETTTTFLSMAAHVARDRGYGDVDEFEDFIRSRSAKNAGHHYSIKQFSEGADRAEQRAQTAARIPEEPLDLQGLEALWKDLS